MDKNKFPIKIYMLSILFLLHLVAIALLNDFWANILSPAVLFFSSYVIYSSVLINKSLDKTKIYLFFFIFTTVWGIIDLSWFIYETFLHIDPLTTMIPYLYTIGSLILTIQALFIYSKSLKQWNKYQLFIDVFSISICLSILMWSLTFSKSNLIFEFNIDQIISLFSMICDFITLTLYTLFFLSNRKKKTSKPFYYAFAGIVLYVGSNFYFVYIDIMNLYIPNTLIDASYTLTGLLFGLSAYLRSIRSVKINKFKNDDAELPFNYGNHSNSYLIILLPFLVTLTPIIGVRNLFIIVIILISYLFSSKYIQISIKAEYLLKKEKNMNENLEKILEERTLDLRNANKILEDISNKDSLTGLYNRRYFLKTLKEFVESNSFPKFALLYMDIDRFKAINDSHGHDIGDKILILLSERFKHKCKENWILFRVGGDEFAIIVKNYKDTEELKVMISTLLYITEQPISIKPYLFNINLSIGISKYPSDAKDMNTLLKYADIAMYEAKKCHSSLKYFFFDNDLSNKIQRKNHLEVMLKNTDFDNEFELYFQPQYRISDNTLVGMEALLRWFHPVDGFIPPGEFIPIAEEIGLIFNIGEWVLDKSFEQIKKWNKSYNTNLQIGINISPLQIENSDFVNRIRKKIQLAQIEPEWIDIEITEGVAMASKTSMEEVFTGLANIGVSISIDDFGTGYSSLSYIKRFDID